MFYVSYILFVIGVLILEFHQHDYSLFMRSSNETALIEKALEEIPKCNSQDRFYQRALLYTFQAWTHYAHSKHVRYWISHRALIGYTQRQGPLPNDQSIDISMLADDTKQLIELIKNNYSSNYELQIHPQWFIRKVSNRSYFQSSVIDFVEYNARYINHKHNVSINIWPVYELSANKETLVEYDRDQQEKQITEKWIFPLRPCMFSGIEVWCPAQPEELVVSVYGRIDLRCANGFWIG